MEGPCSDESLATDPAACVASQAPCTADGGLCAAYLGCLNGAEIADEPCGEEIGACIGDADCATIFYGMLAPCDPAAMVADDGAACLAAVALCLADPTCASFLSCDAHEERFDGDMGHCVRSACLEDLGNGFGLQPDDDCCGSTGHTGCTEGFVASYLPQADGSCTHDGYPGHTCCTPADTPEGDTCRFGALMEEVTAAAEGRMSLEELERSATYRSCQRVTQSMDANVASCPGAGR